MLKNNLKIAWRSLKYNSLFSMVNILGLSLGLAIAIVLYLFITHEHSFDTMYANNDAIYRVLLHTENEGRKEVWCNAPTALTPALKSDIPNVRSAARVFKHNFEQIAFLRVNTTNFIEKNLYWADNELFDIFSVNFLKGHSKNALSRPNTVVLSQSSAQKYFGATDPLGKIITVDNYKHLEVTGVFEDFPSNSTLDCNLIASFNSTNFYKNPSWSNASFETYCLVDATANKSQLQDQIQQILDKNVAKEEQWYSFSLQPLKDIHLYSATYMDSYTSRNGDIKEIKNLSLLALLILVIACINYMNLITARSQKRSKDVGVNKTLGASTKNLIIRFYVETGVITFISLLIAIVLALIVIPIFNTITSQSINIELMLNLKFFVGLFIVWLITTLLSGSYPAIYLSGFSPKAILNPTFKRGNNIQFIRKGLVVLQFTASVVLIIAVLVIYKQLQFIQTKDLGYNPESVMAISTTAIDTDAHLEALLLEFKSLADVKHTAFAQGFPGMGVSGRSLTKNDNDKQGINIQTNVCDAEIADVLQLKLLVGTMPHQKIKGDTLVEVVLNKKAIEYLGYNPNEAIGKKVTMQLGNNATVVGVVDNFNFASLHQPIGAYAFHNNSREHKSYLLVRFNSKSISNIVEQFENAYKKVIPNAAFDYSFLDNNVAQLYVQEKKMSQVSIIFCSLAIFVACLGLFGLVTFTAEQRFKEIGIRKVLGSSIPQIVTMLSKDFLKLVCVSFIVAFPLGYYLMDNWLQGFAYRIQIQWWVFVLAGIITICIAFITIGWKSFSAATMNPVKALRSE